MLAYAVLSEQSDEALYFFVDRRMAERMVENWNRDLDAPGAFVVVEG